MELVKMVIPTVGDTSHNGAVYAGQSSHRRSETDMRDEGGSSIGNTQPAAFQVRASRYRGSLYFIAKRILDDRELARQAVRNCLLAVSRHPVRFDTEGAFRCWLVRVLIDEALLLSAETCNA